jgi:hypothetical protein
MLIQIKQILFLDGKPVFSEEAMASAWKWEQKVRKQNNNNEKCVFFESYFNSLVQSYSSKKTTTSQNSLL